MNRNDSIYKAKKFGTTMTVALLVIGLFCVWRHNTCAFYFFALAGLFQFTAWLKADWLIPIEKIWLRLGHALGWFNTRIILMAVFFLVFAPLRFILLLMGKDLLDERTQKGQKSYWQKRSSRGESLMNYERMY